MRLFSAGCRSPFCSCHFCIIPMRFDTFSHEHHVAKEWNHWGEKYQYYCDIIELLYVINQRSRPIWTSKLKSIFVRGNLVSVVGITPDLERHNCVKDFRLVHNIFTDCKALENQVLLNNRNPLWNDFFRSSEDNWKSWCLCWVCGLWAMFHIHFYILNYLRWNASTSTSGCQNCLETDFFGKNGETPLCTILLRDSHLF